MRIAIVAPKTAVALGERWPGREFDPRDTFGVWSLELREWRRIRRGMNAVFGNAVKGALNGGLTTSSAFLSESIIPCAFVLRSIE